MNPVTKLELLYSIYVIGFLNQVIIGPQGLQMRSRNTLGQPLSFEDFKIEFEDMLKRKQWTEEYVFNQCKKSIDILVQLQQI